MPTVTRTEKLDLRLTLGEACPPIRSGGNTTLGQRVHPLESALARAEGNTTGPAAFRSRCGALGSVSSSARRASAPESPSEETPAEAERIRASA
jgi:hypothetical protein